MRSFKDKDYMQAVSEKSKKIYILQGYAYEPLILEEKQKQSQSQSTIKHQASHSLIEKNFTQNQQTNTESTSKIYNVRDLRQIIENSQRNKQQSEFQSQPLIKTKPTKIYFEKKKENFPQINQTCDMTSTRVHHLIAKNKVYVQTSRPRTSKSYSINPSTFMAKYKTSQQYLKLQNFEMELFNQGIII